MIESTAQQLISRLPKAPDLSKATDGISGFFSGLSSGMKQQGKIQEQEKLAEEGKAPPVTFADRLGGFAGAFLEAEAERNAAADPFFALKQKAYEQNAQLTGLQVAEAMRARDEEIEARSLMQEFSGLVSSAVREGRANDANAIADILEFSGRNPIIMGLPQYKESMTFLSLGQKVQKESANLRRGAEAAAAARAAGMQERIAIGEDGAVRREFGDTARAPSAVPDKLEIADRMSKLQELIETSPDPGVKAAAQRQLTNIQAQMSGQVTEVFDRDQNLIMRSGPAGKSASADSPTTATLTAAQKKLGDTLKTITALEDFQQSLGKFDVGILGVIGDSVLDKALPSLGIPTADAGRMEARTKLKALIEGAMREVSVDTRFSDADRKAVREVLPSSGVLESYEHANSAVNVLRRIFAKRALIDASSAGLTPQPWMLRALDDRGLIEASRQGLMTPEQAKAEYYSRRKKE